MSDATPPSTHVCAANHAVAMDLPFADRADFDDARRGFLGTLSPALVAATDGRVVWDLEAYDFLDEECPDSVNPSLWRQAQLNRIHGLFEVADGIYQVRGVDLSNMTIVEGDHGVLVIDPLISRETAAAALALYREHRGDRPVTGLLYTHCHIDHFGGAEGVITQEDASSGRIPVYAPEGFLQHAVSENVYAGGAMIRRAAYMYGSLLTPGPTGQVSAGLGLTTSGGHVSLVPPTVSITTTGQEEVVDGIRMVFQMTPGTEAPAEMNLHFPERRALCVAENATHNMHNVVTLRGALVRDPRVWAHYLGETIELFGDGTDVVFAQHHWPRWGAERAVAFLAAQRDLYKYLHDQTLRLLNHGHVGSEIAELLELPPGLANEWHCRGYYGSVSHNVKAVYQRYMGWFDGNPAHLWSHPPVPAAERYVAYMGGAEAVLARARASYDEGDYRWVAEVVGHVVFADPANVEARELQARAFEQLGYGAENATWRNFYLSGALELREGPQGTPARAVAGFLAHLTGEQVLDAIAIRVDGVRAAHEHLRLTWIFPDVDEVYALTLANGALTYVKGRPAVDPDATLTIARRSLDRLLLDRSILPELVEAGEFVVDGDMMRLAALFGYLDQPEDQTHPFAIVTP
jgi:alkyl sulfatase BDS1-like metallo-beta-lactamase superfamily hydrolase